ncbi:hypothetical protein B0G77_6055 [Paraburkholderia sp. BL10I2N1]|nr:hypothetical protein B0G77_6055 [Paraburkholderia sp. BL10I2N1]
MGGRYDDIVKDRHAYYLNNVNNETAQKRPPGPGDMQMARKERRGGCGVF